ncbi:hypothetical protein [Hymenobacter koreensis]
MKRVVLLAAAVATLGLGACNRTQCPAYAKAANTTSEPVASSATAAPERQ